MNDPELDRQIAASTPHVTHERAERLAAAVIAAAAREPRRRAVERRWRASAASLAASLVLGVATAVSLHGMALPHRSAKHPFAAIFSPEPILPSERLP